MDRIRLARRIAPLLRRTAHRSSYQLVERSSARSYYHTSKPAGAVSVRTWTPPRHPAFQTSSIRAFASDGGAPGDVMVPFMGDSVPDGTLASFLKQPGDAVVVDDVIAQIETDKVTIDVRSSVAGTLKEVTVKSGDTVKTGDKIATIAVGDTSGKAAAAPEKKAEKAVPAAVQKPAEAKAESKPAPPPKAESKPAPPPKAESKPPPAPTRPLPTTDRERREPMTRIRKRISQRLKDSQNTFAMLSTFNEVDMTNLMALRAKYKDDFQEKHGAKLGFMSAFVKAAVSALKDQPVVNAVIDGDDIVYRNYIDISIAVGTPKGLVVPVVRGVDSMSFADVEKTISALGKRANEGTISIDDMAGGTFTISNGGVYGSLLSTPIINPPQSAILGMHSIQKRPMVVGNEIVARPMMYIALTYDHRLIDGREAVLFLRRIKDVIEDPSRLLLDV